MKRLVGAVALSATLLLSTAGVSMAITDGELDGNGHPYVGLMGAYDDAGNWLWRCSGTLISPTLFLTAGHCTESPAAHVEIWFASDIDAGRPANGYPTEGEAGGRPYTHPEFYDGAFWLHDLGMVVLDKPVKQRTFGILPSVDLLDQARTKRELSKVGFTAVGYGLQQAFPDAASWKDSSQQVRMVAHPRLLQINGGSVGTQSLLLSNNTNTGGTCFGDSGGPDFIGRTDVIAGVTSFGMNGTCAGTGGVYRVDRADDLGWIYDTFGKQLR
jgi:secreted trypsin-like serine protease